MDGERTAGGYQFIAFGWKKNCRWLPVHSIWMEKELQVVTSSLHLDGERTAGGYQFIALFKSRKRKHMEHSGAPSLDAIQNLHLLEKGRER